jgi:arylformamidase
LRLADKTAVLCKDFTLFNHYSMKPPEALSRQDDPDGQMPMPFAAADAYARQVMQWSRETDFSALQVTRDVSYGEHRLQRYDVFSPKNAPLAPVVIFWHGGGWTNGYCQYVHFMAPTLAAMGIALVAPSYRLAPENRLPAAFDDAMACLAHVKGHAHKFNLDGSNIVLSGHSAGGHLASMAALRSSLVDPKLRMSLRACLPISAIMDLHHPCPVAGSLEERVYVMLLADAAQDAVMSPMAWTAGNTLPFELTVGELDSERVRSSNHRFAALLEAQGCPITLHQHADHNHFQTHTALVQASDPWYALVARYAKPTPQADSVMKPPLGQTGSAKKVVLD